MKFSPHRTLLFLEPHRVTPAAVRKAQQNGYKIILHIRDHCPQDWRALRRIRRRLMPRRRRVLAKLVGVYATAENSAGFQRQMFRSLRSLRSGEMECDHVRGGLRKRYPDDRRHYYSLRSRVSGTVRFFTSVL